MSGLYLQVDSVGRRARVKRDEADFVGASSRLVTRANCELHDRNTHPIEGRRDFLLDETRVINDGHLAPRAALCFQRQDEAGDVRGLLGHLDELRFGPLAVRRLRLHDQDAPPRRRPPA